MKKITFTRLISNKEQKLHKELNEVSELIINTFEDLEINPYMTLGIVHNELDRIFDKYDTIIYAEAEMFINELYECIEDDSPIYDTLCDILFLLEDIRIHTTGAAVDVPKNVSENMLNLCSRITRFSER